MIDSIQSVIKHNLCIACGACVAVAPPGTMELRYDPARGLPIPVILDYKGVSGTGIEFDVCPGKGVLISKFARERLEGGESYDLELGYWNGMWAGRSLDKEITKNASSAGVMTAIADYLLSEGKVCGAVVSRMSYGPSGPRTVTYIARDREGLLAAQGSKYCPVSTGLIFQEARAAGEPLAFIGTPCQIAALRLFQKTQPEMNTVFPFVIGNFCGGFSDFRNTEALLRKNGMDPARIVRFRFRGGGQPGSMQAEDVAGRVLQRPYPDYIRETGFSKQRRCLLCIDATAELADFACGDAWIPQFIADEFAWSIIFARTGEAREIIKEMVAKEIITLADVDIEEVADSQRINITSKKRRQFARRRFESMMGRALPEFGGGYHETTGGVVFEAWVAFCRSVREKAETGSLTYWLLNGLGRSAKRLIKFFRNKLYCKQRQWLQ